MALVYPQTKSASLRSWGTVNLSTNTDGVTNSDVLDTGGLAIGAIALSSLASNSCNYTLNVSVDTTGTLQLPLNSTGSIITIGTTATASQQRTFLLDPALFAGFRFVQLVSNTTSAAAANATGATARIGLVPFGPIE